MKKKIVQIKNRKIYKQYKCKNSSNEKNSSDEKIVQMRKI